MSEAANNKYVVQSGDSLVDIVIGLKSVINANSTLSNLGITATSSGADIYISSASTHTTAYTQVVSNGGTETITLGDTAGSEALISPTMEFTASPVLSAGANTISVTAVSGGGTATTNTFPITVSSVANQSFTHDANGNLTSDGTNSFEWDAEDRLVQITILALATIRNSCMTCSADASR